MTKIKRKVKMKEKVLETIKNYKLIVDGDKIVLGVSGGPDSISMLNILNEIKNKKLIDFEIVVAHNRNRRSWKKCAL